MVQQDDALFLKSNFETVELGSILNAQDLQILMDEFFKLTQIGVGITDLRGQVLVSTGWQDICLKFHRVHPVTCRNCLESDTVLSQGTVPGTFKVYRCKNHMYDVATPIGINGRPMGNLVLGQFFFDDEPPDREFFRTQAQQYNFDEEDYLAALDRVPCWSREKVNTAMSFYTQLAHLFSTLSYCNFQLAQSILEQQRTKATLQTSEERLKSIFRAVPVGIGLIRHRVILEANDSFCQMTGYCRQELLGRNTRLLYLNDQDYEWVGHEKYRQIAEQGTGSVEVRWRRKDGEIIWVILSSTPLDGEDLNKGITFTVLNITERKRAEEHIAHLTYHDALTQLPNRVLLTDRLQQTMAQARRDHKRLAVCYLDLDDFKPINDALGSTEGDRLLIEVAHHLKECVRAGDTVARLGGDEFVLLLGNLEDVEECEHALDRLKIALQTPFTVNGQSITLKASLGVTLYPDDDADPDTLLRHSDQAMCVAKQAGGDRYQLFDADYNRRAREYRELLRRIEQGLAAGEFCLHYQPKVDMRHGAIFGAEALIRWQHPEEGLLPPVRFMPTVETSTLAVVIDQWVLNEVLQQMTLWSNQGLQLPISVNLSSDYLQQLNFATQLQALLASYPTVPADRILLEILETAALDDLQTVSQLIVDCQRLGVRFALDDFGTGYSSLTYLKHLPVQLLKIDQSFVRDLLVDAEAQAIVEGIIGLSAAFRREVIAEGVETVEHGCRLLDLGCDLAQGYGIARPMPAEQIPAWIAWWKPPSAWINRVDKI
ncbi:MAG: EAL domain-containing protein [Gammaproteobacteria bacterium]|nr:EAL domain-containing protein [Gammaproteobacteria bacterium]MCP5196149.1 EAL domain-containing protein [Gammaproteobacteria bacterium]